MSKERSRSRSKSPARRDRSRSRSKGRGRSRSRSRSRSRGGKGGRQKGVALRWNDRGFGFIQPEDGSEDVFCHFSGITDGNCLREGDTVEYESTFEERKGKYRAENVTGGRTEDRGGGGGAPRSAGECYDFRDGKCSRGNSCRFSHEGGGGGGGDRYDDRRGGGYDDRRGGGGYDDRRGGGGYDDRRDDRRGGYDDRRDDRRY